MVISGTAPSSVPEPILLHAPPYPWSPFCSLLSSGLWPGWPLSSLHTLSIGDLMHTCLCVLLPLSISWSTHSPAPLKSPLDASNVPQNLMNAKGAHKFLSHHLTNPGPPSVSSFSDGPTSINPNAQARSLEILDPPASLSSTQEHRCFCTEGMSPPAHLSTPATWPKSLLKMLNTPAVFTLPHSHLSPLQYNGFHSHHVTHRTCSVTNNCHVNSFGGMSYWTALLHSTLITLETPRNTHRFSRVY